MSQCQPAVTARSFATESDPSLQLAHCKGNLHLGGLVGDSLPLGWNVEGVQDQGIPHRKPHHEAYFSDVGRRTHGILHHILLL